MRFTGPGTKARALRGLEAGWTVRFALILKIKLGLSLEVNKGSFIGLN